MDCGVIYIYIYIYIFYLYGTYFQEIKYWVDIFKKKFQQKL